MELGDSIQTSVTCCLYVIHCYTCMHIPYEYGYTVRVWYTKLYHTRMVHSYHTCIVAMYHTRMAIAYIIANTYQDCQLLI